MVFSSTTFLGIFFPVFLIFYFVIPKRNYKNVILVLFSLFFYAWGEPVWVFGMIGLTFADYKLAGICTQIKSQRGRYAYIALAVFLNLAMLFLFKYYNFFMGGINGLFHTDIPMLGLGMPIGISFFTFQALTYVVDVYRGETKPQESYLNLLLYISMFPQLIAGPIVRYSDIEAQLVERKETIEGFNSGMFRFSVGLCKKVIFANYAGLITSSLLSAQHMPQLTTSGAWVGILMFLFQLYFDFSGYSDMAIGLGKITGFTYRENFNYPYMANSVTDLWRRWHISLGSFFRDYVYIPLGGNRRHQYFNIIVVWLLTGLWHGASLNYVLWGVYFVAALLIERGLRKIGIDISKVPVIGNVIVLLLIVFGWSIFYFEDLELLKQFLMIMIGVKGEVTMRLRELTPVYQYFFVIIAMAAGATPLPKNIAKRLFPDGSARTEIGRGILTGALILLCYMLLLKQSYNPFLYFRF